MDNIPFCIDNIAHSTDNILLPGDTIEVHVDKNALTLDKIEHPTNSISLVDNIEPPVNNNEQ